MLECVCACVYNAGVQELLSYAPTCKTLLQYMLTILPESGDNYLPVFRCVHGFSSGEGFLADSDEPVLVEQMKLCESPAEEEEGGGGSREERGDNIVDGTPKKCEA